MNKCRCLIADDHPIVRRGVRELLEEEQLSSEICEVRTGEEALEAVRRQSWDVMILDIALPDKHGLEVLKETKLLQPRLPVLMLSLYPEKEFAMRAIKAGASGYLTKQSAPSELLAAVLRVLQGGGTSRRRWPNRWRVRWKPVPPTRCMPDCRIVNCKCFDCWDRGNRSP